jgi:F-type H+-transporting ATPase subunit b
MEALHNLGIDFKVMIAQIINFGILVFILVKFLYRPILKALDDRRKKIKTSLEQAADIEKKHTEAKEEYNSRVLKANQEADHIVEKAKAEAEKTRKAILDKTQKEAEAIRENASKDIESERNALYADVKKSAGKLAIFIVTKVLKQDQGEEFYRKSVEKALEEINA